MARDEAKRAAWRKKYRQRKRATINAQKRACYAAHREEIKAKEKEYREQNAEACKARWRAYYAAHREEILAKQWAARATKEAARDARIASSLSEEWQARNAAYRERHKEEREACNAKTRWRLSIQKYGPEWGPVHRAALDLERAIRSRTDNEKPTDSQPAQGATLDSHASRS